MKYLSIVFICLCLPFILSCGSTMDDAQKRAYEARKENSEFVIGVAWPIKTDKLLQGVELAVEEINGKGGVNGRKIKLIAKDDGEALKPGKLISQEFVENHKMLAVIGHSASFISLPTSITYDYHGMVMISPGSTNPALTKRGLTKVFRSIPNDEKISKTIVDYIHNKLKAKKAVIFYSKDEYGRVLANEFERHADNYNIRIVDRLSYEMDNERYFRSVANGWKSLEFDVIFFAGYNPEGVHFIKALRKAGLNQPILAGDGLDDNELISAGGKDVEGVIVATPLAMSANDSRYKDWVQNFKDKFASEPDAWAAQGYDAIKALESAVLSQKSFEPDKIAIGLKSIKINGIAGVIKFDKNGDLIGRMPGLKKVKNGKFVPVK